MKFYTYSQNNSGGYYIRNEVVDEYLIIEAEDQEQASDKLFDITEGYSESCSCCGPRWGWSWMDDEEDEGKEVPQIYGRPAIGSQAKFVIHYADGKVFKNDSEKGN